MPLVPNESCSARLNLTLQTAISYDDGFRFRKKGISVEAMLISFLRESSIITFYQYS